MKQKANDCHDGVGRKLLWVWLPRKTLWVENFHNKKDPLTHSTLWGKVVKCPKVRSRKNVSVNGIWLARPVVVEE